MNYFQKKVNKKGELFGSRQLAGLLIYVNLCLKACRNKGVDCIVAPYEADAQLAYLSAIGVAQLIISEDSDLLVFGCEKVLYYKYVMK